MSKKNLNVSLKNTFKDFKDLTNLFHNFKNKLDLLNKKKYTVAVSGGPDSLALVALTKAYSQVKKGKFYYVIVDHNIRKNSALEAKQVKKLLKKHKINLNIILNKKKIQSYSSLKNYIDLVKKFGKKVDTTVLNSINKFPKEIIEKNVDNFIAVFKIGIELNKNIKKHEK